MIDWLEVEVCLKHEPLGEDFYKKFIDGEFEREIRTKQIVFGSFSSTTYVKSLGVENGNANKLKIWCSPAKHQQGHNVWGSNEVQPVARCLIFDVLERLGLTPSPDEIEKINKGKYKINKIHITESYRLGSQQEVLDFVYALTNCAKSNHKMDAKWSDQTVQFGHLSRRWTLKVYAKGVELKAHPLPSSIPHRQQIEEFASNLLRIELEMESMELSDLGLRDGYKWDAGKAQAVYFDKLKAVDVPINIPLKDEQVKALPVYLRGTYLAWEQGHDLRRDWFPNRTTFKNHRDKILSLTDQRVDIGVPVRNHERSTMVPMWRSLIPEPVKVPAWALLHPKLYFDPHKQLNAANLDPAMA
ncbi:Phage replication protein CRI [compost metagenome]